MLLGAGLVVLSVWILLGGLSLHRAAGALAGCASGVVVFLFGRGVAIDGRNRTVYSWAGWIERPLFWWQRGLSEFSALEIQQRMRPSRTLHGSSKGVGFWFVLSLVAREGRRILLRASSRAEITALATEVAELSGLVVEDLWQRTLDDRERAVRERIADLAAAALPGRNQDRWRVQEIEHHLYLVYATIESAASNDRFRLVVSFHDSPHGRVEGAYRFEAGQFVLVFAPRLRLSKTLRPSGRRG